MKRIPCKFRIVNPRNSGVIYPWMKVAFFLKISLFFFIFVNKHFINKGEYISKSKRCYGVGGRAGGAGDLNISGEGGVYLGYIQLYSQTDITSSYKK